MKRPNLCIFALILAMSPLTKPAIAGADNKDTPEDVMRAGKAATTEIDSLIGSLKQRAGSADTRTKEEIDRQMRALAKLRTLFGRLGQDRSFATQVLDRSLKNDKLGLGELFKKETPGVEFQVREIKDWFLYVFFSFDGSNYDGCVSSDNSCGGGKSFRFGPA